mmetsp:Transcript_7473/g.21811  ORF Transcript_7473/g.21811 Transcript_7473/m.21811 type:complete len:84 (+) Transcript_7473:1383-1634(+)
MHSSDRINNHHRSVSRNFKDRSGCHCKRSIGVVMLLETIIIFGLAVAALSADVTLHVANDPKTESRTQNIADRRPEAASDAER